MAKYIKKPDVVEAVQWNGDGFSEMTHWIIKAVNEHPTNEGYILRMKENVILKTNIGNVTAGPDWWITCDANGVLFAYSPEQFSKLFERAKQ